MSEPSDPFDALQAALQSGGPEEVLQQTIARLRADKRAHELFHALKMQLRLQAHLPLVQEGEEDLDEPTRQVLEDGLFCACREVGEMLVAAGRIRDGWMYLRAVGERKAVAELLQGIEADDHNLEELIDVCLHEGVDPARGFQLVLEHFGTCNSITTMDSVVAQLPAEHQRQAAQLLLRHLHQELLANIRGDIAQQEGRQPEGQTLAELVADRDWLFGEHSYHVDTTHLASTVRFAEMLTDPESLRLALDLTEYGRRLHPQFQFLGDEPFAETYPAHALFFGSQLGQQVDEAVAYFRDKAESLDPREQGTGPIEIYIDLLHRLGRHADAIDTLRTKLPADIPTRGIAPSLLKLCQDAGDYGPLLQHCRQTDDLVGFATGLLQQ